MTDVKVERGDDIFTPGNETFALKAGTGIGDPDLLADGSGYVLLCHLFMLVGLSISSHDYACMSMTTTSHDYKFGTIIRPSIAKKKTTVWSSRPAGVAAPMGCATSTREPNRIWVNL